MEEEVQSEKERAKQVFEMMDEKKPVMPPEQKQMFTMGINLVIAFGIFLLIVLILVALFLSPK